MRKDGEHPVARQRKPDDGGVKASVTLGKERADWSVTVVRGARQNREQRAEYLMFPISLRGSTRARRGRLSLKGQWLSATIPAAECARRFGGSASEENHSRTRVTEGHEGLLSRGSAACQSDGQKSEKAGGLPEASIMKTRSGDSYRGCGQRLRSLSVGQSLIDLGAIGTIAQDDTDVLFAFAACAAPSEGTAV